jgi:hypothetical protein
MRRKILAVAAALVLGTATMDHTLACWMNGRETTVWHVLSAGLDPCSGLTGRHIGRSARDGLRR